MGFEVITVGTAHRFADILKKEKDRVVLIIMDIMLFPVLSLEGIGIPNSATDDGYEAGWIIIERFLRSDDSPEVTDEYKHIPILVVTSKKLYDNDSARLKAIKDRRGEGWIKYLEKHGINKEGILTWVEQFEDIIKNLMKELKMEVRNAG
jgi:hypothetical protein